VTGRAGTLVLARRDISELMHAADWLQAVETGFRAAAEGRAAAPAPMHLHGQGGAFHAKGASLQLERLYVALKLNGNFPSNPAERSLPTIQGAVLLCDGETGALLAIMDSIEITLRRTAAATALAARFLARPDSATILICGCGAQGAAQLAALRDVLPLRRLFAWDLDPVRACAFADAVEGVEVAVAPDLAAAAIESDVIVTCTTAREPFLAAEMVAPGTFVAAVGADSPDKSEIRPDLMARALVVADVLDQCVEMGDLHHAFAAGAMRREDVHAELAGLVGGVRTGRTSRDQITLFDSTGTALQDVAAAVRIYAQAVARPGRLTIDLAA
jgi:ornithine cyclodeaminase/alanine dehydrogenase-like protein (mu-crystallin family)